MREKRPMGAVVWWSLAGPTDGATLARVWTADGLPEVRLPKYANGAVSEADLGEWISGRLLFALSAVSLKERAGFHFILRDQIPNWDSAGLALARLDHKLLRTVLADDPVTREIVLRALEQETRAAIDAAEVSLDTCGPRARAQRLQDLEWARDKLMRYTMGLTERLPDLEARIGDLASRIAGFNEGEEAE